MGLHVIVEVEECPDPRFQQRPVLLLVLVEPHRDPPVRWFPVLKSFQHVPETSTNVHFRDPKEIERLRLEVGFMDASPRYREEFRNVLEEARLAVILDWGTTNLTATAKAYVLQNFHDQPWPCAGPFTQPSPYTLLFRRT